MGTVRTSKGGRKRTGTMEEHGTHADGSPRFRFRVRLGDGTKSERFDVPHGMDETRARSWVAGIQAQEDAQGLLLAKKHDARRASAEAGQEAHEGERCAAWFARYVTRRESEIASAGDIEDHWRKWLEPHLGPKPIASLRRADIEAVRNALDDAVKARRVRPKTAQNVWGTLTRAMKEAASSKDPSLRVFDVSPCTNVQPPIKGEPRRKSFFYPKEIASLLSCEGVPLAWRFTYACAAYLGLRPNELAELRFSDIEEGATWIVNVSRAIDWRTGEVKPPKTSAGIRMVPVPKSFVPWLEWERKRHDENDLVCPLVRSTGRHRIAAHFRAHLVEAGVNHPRLVRDDDVWMPANFRSLRDTCATWLAVSGLNVAALQRRLGHKSVDQSLHYAKVAEDLSGSLGDVFPAVFGPAFGPEASEVCGTMVEAPGIEPSRHARNSGDPAIPTWDSVEIPPQNPIVPSTIGPAIGPAPTLDDALTSALLLATQRGDLALVARIVSALEARRRAVSPNVVTLAPGARVARPSKPKG